MPVMGQGKWHLLDSVLFPDLGGVCLITTY